MTQETTPTKGATSVPLDKIVMPFSSLALGARFRYNPPGDDYQTFVKISRWTVAEWKDELAAQNWVGQGVYSFNDDETDDNVELVA